MDKKKTLIIGLSIIAVCLLIVFGYMFTNRSTKREPTPQETEAYAPYGVDWQNVTGTGDTDKEIILSLCTFTEEKTIGENVYKMYTSDTLEEYLYKFGEMIQVAELDSVLYVQYTDSDGNTITLGYDDTGLRRKAFTTSKRIPCITRRRELWRSGRSLAPASSGGPREVFPRKMVPHSGKSPAVWVW